MPNNPNGTNNIRPAQQKKVKEYFGQYGASTSKNNLSLNV